MAASTGASERLSKWRGLVTMVGDKLRYQPSPDFDAPVLQLQGNITLNSTRVISTWSFGHCEGIEYHELELTTNGRN